MKLINQIPRRLETPERYDNNRDINIAIAKAFKDSVSQYSTPGETITELFVNPCSTVPSMARFSDEYQFYKDIPGHVGGLDYANTSIAYGGCAIPCLHQGLMTRGIFKDIRDLASMLGALGYYETNKGTYHNLFDHWGLRRATHYQEIFDNLTMGSIVTLLINNGGYSGNSLETGRAFINIVGLDADLDDAPYFYVDDPALDERRGFEAIGILEATEVAWIW